MTTIQNLTPPEQLQSTKSKKKLILTGTSRFNTKPKTGLAFLEENKLIYNDPNEPRALSLARFLKSSARIDKRLLGDFISKPDNIELLKSFLMLMDFKGVRIRPQTSRLYSELGTILRNPSQKLFEKCWKHSVCPVNPNKSTASRRRSQKCTSPRNQVF